MKEPRLRILGEPFFFALCRKAISPLWCIQMPGLSVALVEMIVNDLAPRVSAT